MEFGVAMLTALPMNKLVRMYCGNATLCNRRTNIECFIDGGSGLRSAMFILPKKLNSV